MIRIEAQSKTIVRARVQSVTRIMVMIRMRAQFIFEAVYNQATVGMRSQSESTIRAQPTSVFRSFSVDS